jgi:hypothetical protein
VAIVTNTFLTFDAIGNREDLQNKIFNIAPLDCPVLNMSAKKKATARVHDWQTQALAAAGANAQIEGDETAFTAVTPTARVTNRTQISRKEVVISDTQETVDKAGRDSEMMYQIGLKRNELKRDMEFVLTNNQVPVTGNSTTAPQLRPLKSWYITGNSSFGAGGSAGTTSAAATDGTQRALTEDLFKTVAQAVWTAGGMPGDVVVGPVNKQKVSAFAGNATRMDKSEDKTVVATVDVYESDFGKYRIHASRFSRDRDMHILDRSLLGIAYLRPMKLVPLAKTGDAEKAHVVVEYTLEVGHPSGIGVVNDLTTTL